MGHTEQNLELATDIGLAMIRLDEVKRLLSIDYERAYNLMCETQKSLDEVAINLLGYISEEIKCDACGRRTTSFTLHLDGSRWCKKCEHQRGKN